MKKTLRQKIEKIRMNMIERIDYLHESMAESMRKGDNDKVVECDIKLQQLIMQVSVLGEALEC